jgi:putative transcriptional regulator
MNHHPPDDLLASYAAGNADDGEALLVATHLALCPRCRLICDDLDQIGGALLTREVPLPDGGLEAVLARLDTPEPPRKPMPPAGPNDIPMPLRGYTGPLAEVQFRSAGPGIWRFDLPHSRPDRPVALLSLRPGLTVPPHRHSGTERGLVLTGSFTDEGGRYGRGDVSIRTPDDPDVHRQQIDTGDRCVVLMVDDGAKIPTTLMGRMVNFLFGL